MSIKVAIVTPPLKARRGKLTSKAESRAVEQKTTDTAPLSLSIPRSSMGGSILGHGRHGFRFCPRQFNIPVFLQNMSDTPNECELFTCSPPLTLTTISYWKYTYEPRTYEMSRLDKLIQIIDTGSTPSIKQTAAKQLGQISRLSVGNDERYVGVDGEWIEAVRLIFKVRYSTNTRNFINICRYCHIFAQRIGILELQHPLQSNQSSNHPGRGRFQQTAQV